MAPARSSSEVRSRYSEFQSMTHLEECQLAPNLNPVLQLETPGLMDRKQERWNKNKK